MNTITLPASTIKRLEKLSADTRRAPKSIVKQVVKEKLEYEEWVLQQIEAGLDDVQARRVVSHEELLNRLAKARHERKHKKAA
jgi:predicted transcriptional regulator